MLVLKTNKPFDPCKVEYLFPEDEMAALKLPIPFGCIVAIIILISLMFVFGMVCLAYPDFSNWWNSVHSAKLIHDYEKTVEKIEPDDYSDIFEEAELYNKSLLNNNRRWLTDKKSFEKYSKIMDFASNGIMAYIEIPKLNLRLPIYHGTTPNVLQVGLGHMEGSSFPIGGKGTHTVISGHRGTLRAKLFTDIPNLEKGDEFYIHVLDRVLTYRVDHFATVLPNDRSPIEIDPNQDYVSLMTCTPYAVNSHRFFVRGVRVENEIEEVEDTVPHTHPNTVTVRFPFLVVGICGGLSILFVGIMIFLLISLKRTFCKQK